MTSTKRQSLEEISADGSRCRSRRRVYSVIKAHPGLSRSEVSCLANMKECSVCGRVNELVSSGDVIELGTKLDQMTKKNVGRLYSVIGPREQLKLDLK